MKLTDDNVRLEKTEKGYCIKIEMPDGSRNYLHSQDFMLPLAIQYRDEIIGLELDKASILVNEDEGYYRLYVPIVVGENSEFEAQFHSRKLNLQDVLYERMQLAIEDK